MRSLSFFYFGIGIYLALGVLFHFTYLSTYLSIGFLASYLFGSYIRSEYILHIYRYQCVFHLDWRVKTRSIYIYISG